MRTNLAFYGCELEFRQAAAAVGGELQQLAELLTIEGLPLGGALNLDELALSRHNHVHIRFGANILCIG